MGRQKIAAGNFFRPIRDFFCLSVDTHGFTVGYSMSLLRSFWVHFAKICEIRIKTGRAHFAGEAGAIGELVSVLDRTSEAFTCRIFLSRVTIVLSSPTDAATRPRITCPSASR